MSDAKFRHPCSHCKTTALVFDLYDEKPVLCPTCSTIVQHPGLGGANSGIEMLRAADRHQEQMMNIRQHSPELMHLGHEFISSERMGNDDLAKAIAELGRECFKRMSLPADDWPLRLDSILDLLGLGHAGLPPGTKERDENLRKLLGDD